MIAILFLAILVIVLIIVLTRSKVENFIYPLTKNDNNFILSRRLDFVESISGFSPNSQVEISFQYGSNVIKIVLLADSNGVMKWNQDNISLPMVAIPYSQTLINSQAVNLYETGTNVPQEAIVCTAGQSIKFPVDTVTGRIYLTIQNGFVSN